MLLESKNTHIAKMRGGHSDDASKISVNGVGALGEKVTHARKNSNKHVRFVIDEKKPEKSTSTHKKDEKTAKESEKPQKQEAKSHMKKIIQEKLLNKVKDELKS